VHICLRFGEREESRLYKDLVTILENLHIRRYVSVGLHHNSPLILIALDAVMPQQHSPTPNPQLSSSIRFNPESTPDEACPASTRSAPGEDAE